MTDKTKPFKFFKESHFRHPEIVGKIEETQLVADYCNKLLNEQGKILGGYDKGATPYLWSVNIHDNDTHKALMICPRKIEKEVECDHKFMVLDLNKFFEKTIEKLNVHSYCPKCGKDLR